MSNCLWAKEMVPKRNITLWYARWGNQILRLMIKQMFVLHENKLCSYSFCIICVIMLTIKLNIERITHKQEILQLAVRNLWLNIREEYHNYWHQLQSQSTLVLLSTNQHRLNPRDRYAKVLLTKKTQHQPCKVSIFRCPQRSLQSWAIFQLDQSHFYDLLCNN